MLIEDIIKKHRIGRDLSKKRLNTEVQKHGKI
jgi:hypothetical protein